MAITTKLDDTKFYTLLERWNHHRMLRRANAPIADLAKSRAQLDSARLAAYQAKTRTIAA